KNNQITEIETGFFNSNLRIKELDLSGNQISKLKSGTFDSLIFNLNLSGNQISEIDPGTFSNIIGHLNLSNNNISQIMKSVFDDPFDRILANFDFDFECEKEIKDNLFRYINELDHKSSFDFPVYISNHDY